MDFVDFMALFNGGYWCFTLLEGDATMEKNDCFTQVEGQSCVGKLCLIYRGCVGCWSNILLSFFESCVFSVLVLTQTFYRLILHHELQTSGTPRCIYYVSFEKLSTISGWWSCMFIIFNLTNLSWLMMIGVYHMGLHYSIYWGYHNPSWESRLTIQLSPWRILS